MKARPSPRPQEGRRHHAGRRVHEHAATTRRETEGGPAPSRGVRVRKPGSERRGGSVIHWVTCMCTRSIACLTNTRW